MATSSLVKLWNRSNLLADKAVTENGGYFVGTNPTPGTALAFAVNASFDVTKGLFVYRNRDAVGGKNVHIDYLKIIPTVAPASGTAAHVALYTDTVNRYTSGGTQITPVNVSNSGQQGGSICDLFAASGGTVITVATAGQKVKLISRSVLRAVIPAINDEMVLAFGDSPAAAGSSATAAGRSATNVVPGLLTPGDNLVVIVWFPSNAATGLSYEFETGWSEQ